MSAAWPSIKLKTALKRTERFEPREDFKEYVFAGTYSFARGVFSGDRKLGASFKLPKIQRVKAGDFVYCKIMAWEGAFGTVPEVADDCVMSGAFVAYQPNPTVIDPKYLDWYFRAPSNWQRVGRKSSGTNVRRKSLHPDQFENTEIPLPPLDEQRRIVARIEELAAKVDEAKRTRKSSHLELVALRNKALQERRQQLSAEYPHHTLRSLTKVTAGGTPSRDVAAYWGGDIPWIKTGELVDGDIESAEEHVTRAGLDNSSAKLFPPDTVLIALYGQGQTRGRTGRLKISAATNQACCAVLPCSELHPLYLQWWLRSLYSELREDAKGGAQPNWSGEMIKNLAIAVPSISEQEAVVKELDFLFQGLDTVKALQEETADELDAMMPAVLDKAFKGKL